MRCSGRRQAYSLGMVYWTVEEARAELPRVRLLIDALRRGSHQATTAQMNGHGSLAGSTRSEPPSSVDDGDDPDPSVAIDVATALAELQAKGIVLRDADTGLLDFPAITAKGVIYLLCWNYDEVDLAWWHFAEEGLAGRKPLPIPPDL